MLVGEIVINKKLLTFLEYANNTDELLKEKEISELDKIFRKHKKIEDYPIDIEITWFIKEDDNTELAEVSFYKLFIIEAMNRSGLISDSSKNMLVAFKDSFIETDSVGCIIRVYAETEEDRTIEQILLRIGKYIDDMLIKESLNLKKVRLKLFKEYLESIKPWIEKSNRVRVMYDYAVDRLNEERLKGEINASNSVKK